MGRRLLIAFKNDIQIVLQQVTMQAPIRLFVGSDALNFPRVRRLDFG